MRIAFGVSALALLAATTPAWSQANPGPQSGPLGNTSGRGGGPSNDPGSGSGDIPGTGFGLPANEAAAGVPKGNYGIELMRRITDARKLVDAVDHGHVLTTGDMRRIRNLMREDFIAWGNRYDLLPSAYRAEKDRWLVEEQSLTPNEWARQRLKWLEAQRQWIVSHGG
jgi:hypothetical protein